jgi:hypothetical protein
MRHGREKSVDAARQVDHVGNWAEVLFYLGTVRSVQAGYFGTVRGTVPSKKLGTRYGTEYRYVPYVRILDGCIRGICTQYDGT